MSLLYQQFECADERHSQGTKTKFYREMQNASQIPKRKSSCSRFENLFLCNIFEFGKSLDYYDPDNYWINFRRKRVETSL